MRWGAFFSTTVVVTFIILYEWPKMKQHPKKDKIAFFMLLFISWGLSMFDLPHMAGPAIWVETFFKPFGQFMEK